MHVKRSTFPLSLLLAGLFLLSNCDKNPQPPVCTDGCAFTLNEASGTIIKMACFNRYAIQARHPQTDSIIYAVPDQMDARFEEEGKSVHVSGVLRENTLQPSFPDPSFSPDRIYQMEITDIR